MLKQRYVLIITVNLSLLDIGVTHFIYAITEGTTKDTVFKITLQL